MAERRMFSKTIIDGDLFLDMSLSTQSLYFHLSMRADDDGFVNNPKRIQRMIGAGDDELKILIAKSFIIPFESGICVIKHWKIHNFIRNDRYKETLFINEKNQLEMAQSKEYELKKDVGIPNDNQMDTQVRLGQVRLGQSSLGKSSSSMNDIGDDDDVIEIFKLCSKLNLDLKIIDIKDFVDIYGFVEIKKAVLSAKSASKKITNPIAYLNKVLTNNTQSSQTIINNNITKEVKPNGNFEGRDNKHDEDLEGWIN